MNLRWLLVKGIVPLFGPIAAPLAWIALQYYVSSTLRHRRPELRENRYWRIHLPVGWLYFSVTLSATTWLAVWLNRGQDPVHWTGITALFVCAVSLFLHAAVGLDKFSFNPGDIPADEEGHQCCQWSPTMELRVVALVVALVTVATAAVAVCEGFPV